MNIKKYLKLKKLIGLGVMAVATQVILGYLGLGGGEILTIDTVKVAVLLIALEQLDEIVKF